MVNLLFYRTLSIISVSVAILFLHSCGNDIETVKSITQIQSGPSMSAKNIEVIFSENGRLQAKLNSPLLHRYEGDKPYLEFPQGFRIEMYDSLRRPATTITGKYGKQDQSTRVMEAKGNVVVRNELEKKQLDTEHLTWDENRQLIFSDVAVKITTPDKVLFGSGIKANEAFTWYQIPNVSATMTVKNDSI
jgi:LPS export ABC transporter protein LptC